MKISEAIKMIQGILKNVGDVEVYFDCPNCKQSFTPDVIKTVAVHITEKK